MRIFSAPQLGSDGHLGTRICRFAPNTGSLKNHKSLPSSSSPLTIGITLSCPHKKVKCFFRCDYFTEFSLTNGFVCGLMTNNDIRKTLKENSLRITEHRELTVGASQFPDRDDLAPESVL